MILLSEPDYNKIIEPLKAVEINNIFAMSVVEKQISGLVYVDNLKHPTTFYIVHPYGMTLLFGKSNNSDFNNKFKEYALNLNKTRKKSEWMQTFPRSWDAVLEDLFSNKMVKSADNVGNVESNKVELNTRVNFKFNKSKYIELRNSLNLEQYQIQRTTLEMFDSFNGSVIPNYFFKDSQTFIDKGVGFSLIHENKIVSTAFASFILGNILEFGIETVEGYKGKGFALYVCAALMDYSLANNYEPVWACRLENIGSYRLAKKLGFEPSAFLPYYRLAT